MKKIAVYIIEDNAITAKDLSEILSENGMHILGISYAAEDALIEIETIDPDVILVDIKLKGAMSGIDFVRAVQKFKTTPVVYLTANSDNNTLQQALDTLPSAFLTKPFNQKQVLIALELAFKNHLEKATQQHNQVQTPYIFIKTKDRFEKVATDKIQYLEADGSYSKVVTSDKEYTLTGNLSQYCHLSSCFLRIHRSFVVNINNITSMDATHIFLQEKPFPIGRSYKDDIRKLLKKFS